MRVSREQAAANRARVVAAAGRLFRERGFDGVAVADLMQAAGLTHGGFYGHFASKEALAAEACGRNLEEAAERWQARAAAAPKDPFGAIVRGYLDFAHRDDPGSGCVLSALGEETRRQGPAVRRSVTAGLERLVAALQAALPGRAARRRRRALATLATLTGALILARAVDDPALSDEILTATAAELGVS